MKLLAGPLSQRLREGAFCCPPALQTVVKRLVRDAVMTRPLRHRSRFAVVLNDAIRPLIVRLHDLGGPAHVARFVVAVVVDAVKRMLLGWPLPNVAQERMEVMPPLLADANASRPVVLEHSLSWLVAARVHLSPNHELGRDVSSGCESVRGTTLFGQFARQASTRLGMAVCQVASADRTANTTRALAQPSAVLASARKFANHRQASKLFTDHALYFTALRAA